MIATRPRALPQATLIYSPPGVGKTEFAAHYEDPVFIMVGLELGLMTLINTGRVPNTPYWDKPVETWGELNNALDYVITGEHDRKTLVIDTANGAQRLCKEEVIVSEFNSDEAKFEAYGKGWERSLTYWMQFLNRLQVLRIKRGMRVVLLCHSLVMNFRNPEGDDYQKHSPELNEKHIWNPTNAWVDNVFFMDMEVNAVKEKGTNRSKAKKGKEHRQLYVEATPSHFAKNRFGLRQPISMGTCGREAFDNFRKAVQSTQKKPAPQPQQEPAEQRVQPEPSAKQGGGEPLGEQAPQEVCGITPAGSAPLADGPEWVKTWCNRITAATKIGPAVSIFNDLLEDYKSSPEPDQVMHFPRLFMVWLEHCVSMGGKAHEQVLKKLLASTGLDKQTYSSLVAALDTGKAA